MKRSIKYLRVDKAESVWPDQDDNVPEFDAEVSAPKQLLATILQQKDCKGVREVYLQTLLADGSGHRWKHIDNVDATEWPREPLILRVKVLVSSGRLTRGRRWWQCFGCSGGIQADVTDAAAAATKALVAATAQLQLATAQLQLRLAVEQQAQQQAQPGVDAPRRPRHRGPLRRRVLQVPSSIPEFDGVVVNAVLRGGNIQHK